MSCRSVLFPRLEVRLYFYLFKSVECNDVEFPGRVVVLGRISGGHDYPALRQPVPSEYFVLQELHHKRRQCLGYAVDLIQKQYALLYACRLHQVVHRSDDLAHRVFGDIALFSAIDLAADERQSYRALARMVCHRVRNQAYTQLRCELFHDGGLAYTRRTDQQHRPLLFDRYHVVSEIVLCQICRDGIPYLFFCLAYVHIAFLTEPKLFLYDPMVS